MPYGKGKHRNKNASGTPQICCHTWHNFKSNNRPMLVLPIEKSRFEKDLDEEALFSPQL